MNSEPQPAYLNLINQLLTCPSGEEQEILNTHPELLDDGLVAAMLKKADNLREQGELNNANWLKNFAGLLGKVAGEFLAGVALKAEADRLFNQGNQQHKISQFRESLQSWEQALTIYREIGYRQGEAASFGNLGNAYNSLGQYQKAIDFHQQSLEISQEIGNRQGEAASLGNLGNAYQSLGQYQKAIDFHQQSLEIEREIGNRQGESISLNNLGNTLLKTNQLAEAETALRASIQIRETLRFELVNNDHKASIFETQVASYRLLQKVLVAQTKFDQALEISEMSRTRAFVELLQQTLLTNELPTNDATNRLSIPKIQQIAPERNCTIVEYSIVESDIIYIWVIQPNGNIKYRAANLEPLTQQNQTLKQIILKTRVSIGSKETDDDGNKIQLEREYQPNQTGGYPLLQLLHQILIEPIIDLLPTDANNQIIFIPHYDLFLVPFVALQDSKNRSPLFHFSVNQTIY